MSSAESRGDGRPANLDPRSRVRAAELEEHFDALGRALHQNMRSAAEHVLAWGVRLAEIYSHDGRLFACGNGGSAADKPGPRLYTTIITAGAAGPANAADLGSRTIREEIDAMRTMGVDPLQRLVG
ncbi:ABC transporter permease, partial [Nocardia cyriacigeorgica]|uniref:ABC transporter permease n=1 Tax=Nocardia cyriacigeorgica TaxID=135487 RepID=UPI0024558F79